MEKVKDSYNELKKDANIFENNNHPNYHKYLQNKYKEMIEKVIEYGYQINDEDNSLDYNNYQNNNNTTFNINDTNDNMKNMPVKVQLNQGDSQNNKEQLDKNKIHNTNGRIIKEDFDTSKNIRKFKKAVRKIKKLKKLYHEIDKETKEDLKRYTIKKRIKNVFVLVDLLFCLLLLV